MFLVIGTSHPRRSLMAWPRWPTSNLSPLNFYLLCFDLVKKSRRLRRQRAPSSPLSLILSSKGQRILGGPRGPDRNPPARHHTVQIAFLHQLIIDIPQLALFMRLGLAGDEASARALYSAILNVTGIDLQINIRAKMTCAQSYNHTSKKHQTNKMMMEKKTM